MTNTTSLTCTTRRPHNLLDLGQAIGTGGGGPFAAVKIGCSATKTGGIIDWWITDKPPELTVGI